MGRMKETFFTGYHFYPTKNCRTSDIKTYFINYCIYLTESNKISTSNNCQWKHTTIISSSTSDLNPKFKISNITAIKDNLSYIMKFGLSVGVTKHSDSCLILNNVYFKNSTILSNIELNSWVYNYLKSYQLDSNFVVYMMLEVFQDKFDGWEHIVFSRLGRYIRHALKKILMAKKIYIGKSSDRINQCLAIRVMNEQLPIWKESKLLKYQWMYQISKTWILFELWYSHLSWQISSSIEENFDSINIRRQQTFISELFNIIPKLVNIFDLKLLICQPTISLVLAQIRGIPIANLL